MNEINLTIAIPTSGMVRIQFMSSVIGLMSKVVGSGVPSRSGEAVSMRLDTIVGPIIHANREVLIRRALEREQTHVMFLDDDMAFDPGVLNIMLGRRRQIVLTNYLIKTDQPEFTAISLDQKRISTREEDTGLQSIYFSGFGVSLFELEVFKQIPQPWFLPEWNDEQKAYSVEDQAFFERVRKSGMKVMLDHDASKLVSHWGNREWRCQQMWQESSCP